MSQSKQTRQVTERMATQRETKLSSNSSTPTRSIGATGDLIKKWGCYSLVVVVAGCGGGSGGGSTAGGGTSTASSGSVNGNGGGGMVSVTVPPVASPLQHILFVGDSFTHGRYTPVRPYNSAGTQNATTGSALVVDENYGATGKRAETLEAGPYGGIPGIFAEFAVESKLNYDVHIEAISETSLAVNFANASSVIEQSKWNAVVLQELSTKPLPTSLTMSTVSNPAAFCSSVKTIEQGVHGAAAAAQVYLYEPWPRADLAQALAGSPTGSNFSASYLANLTLLANANHNAYYSAAAHDGAIAAVAPTGEAWQRAWAQGVANPNPYATPSTSPALPLLWYGINPVNDPAITAPDYLHPSVYGAYLSGLVLFQQIAGIDVRTLGASEVAAAQLGIPSAVATQLQQIAWQTVGAENPAPVNQSVDPCTLTQ
jgi:hypothetical protein